MNSKTVTTLLAAVLISLSGVAAATGQASAAPRFCDQNLQTGKQHCFASEAGLLEFENAAAVQPLVTFFNDINWKGAGGYKNFSSAWGASTCSPSHQHEASDGDFTDDRYPNTNVTLENTVSSFYVRPDSKCVIFGFQDSRFNTPLFGWSTGDPDLTGWCECNDSISSFYLVAG